MIIWENDLPTTCKIEKKKLHVFNPSKIEKKIMIKIKYAASPCIFIKLYHGKK